LARHPFDVIRRRRFWASVSMAALVAMLGLVMAVCSSCQSVPDTTLDGRKAGSDEERERFASLVKEADDLYATQPRSEKRVRLSATKYSEAIKISSIDYDALWKGARAHGWLAQYTTQSAERAKLAGTGVTYCRTALKLRPNATEGLFYLAILSGLLSDADSSYGLSAVNLMDESLRKIIESGADIEHGGAHRVLGTLLSDPRLPGPPTSIGSLRNGKVELEAAVEKAPDWPENHLYLAKAELLWAKDKNKPAIAQKARDRLNKYLLRPDAKAPAGYEFEFAQWQSKARELLADNP
jgi:hypothetical protein